MNILYLTDTGDLTGGGEMSLLSLLAHLNRSRFAPIVVVPSKGALSERLETMNIPVRVMPFKKVSNILNVMSTIRSVQRLADIIKSSSIDLIHTNSTGGIMFLGGFAARAAGIPMVSHIRIFDTGMASDLAQSLLSTKIVVISKSQEHKFRLVKDKVVLIYNGVDLEGFNDRPGEKVFRKEIGCKEGAPLIGTMGAYKAGKGFEYFIKAARMIADEVPDTKFVIVGLKTREGGEHCDYLRGLTKELGLAERVVFLEGRKDVAAILSSLEIFIFPSLIDPFGRVLIEAMACAKPVVAFRCGGIPEIVEDGATGFLVPSRDYRSLAEKAIMLLKDKKISGSFGRAGRSRVEELFDIKEHARKIEALYTEVLEKRS